VATTRKYIQVVQVIQATGGVRDRTADMAFRPICRRKLGDEEAWRITESWQNGYRTLD
jgi:hypothetical protein